ncbi:MAG: AraC family transcriptional regulator [Planctomycetota bacterium]|jgi:AraC-like DNA-binding protein|nr:AraC family transcriptional regulator [Planctomycetota bacterium]
MDASALQVLFAGRLRRHLGTKQQAYTEHWALHFIIDGRATVRIGAQTHHLSGDWVWTGYPGPAIGFEPAGKLPRLHYRAALHGDALKHWLDEGLWPRAPLPVSDVSALQHHGDALLAHLHGDEALDTRLRRNALEGFLLELHRQQRHHAPPPSWVLDCQRQLERSWNREPDYAQLAKRYQMPLHTLRRNFKRATGIAIHTWLLQRRHREAQSRLLDSDDSLAAIAEQCGFKDPGFFSRQFKAFAGMSPSAFRRARYG